MDKETNIIFQLYGKRNDAVSITLDEYFSALPINEIIMTRLRQSWINSPQRKTHRL